MNADIKIALSAYYKARGLSNTDIAVLLRVDVSSVSRYLKQAEGNNWLQQKVQLRLPRDLDREVQATARSVDLEEELFGLFSRIADGGTVPPGLRREGIVVVRSVEAHAGKSSRHNSGRLQEKADELNLAMMAVEGGRLLVDLLTERDRDRPTVLGVTWGRSTGAVAAHLGGISLPELQNLVVVAMQGGIGRSVSFDIGSQYPDILAERLSMLFRSQNASVSITLPAYVGSLTAAGIDETGLKAIWKFIESDVSFQHAVSKHERLDVALIGVGGFEPGAWALSSGYLPDASAAASLRRVGAVGDIACRFFRGHPEEPIEGWVRCSGDCELIRQTNLRAIGISLVTLRSRVRAGARVLAAAGGHSGAKAAAIRAAVAAGFVTSVVTDERTALAILGEIERDSARTSPNSFVGGDL